MPGLRLPDSETTIDVCVIDNPTDDQVVFKLRKSTPLIRLIEAFHAHRRQPPSTYLLFYRDQQISPRDTPASLCIRSTDFLVALPNPALSPFPHLPSSSSRSFYVTVLDTQFSHPEYLFRLRHTTPMEKLMQTYCARIGTSFTNRQFFFHSAQIEPHDTPRSLGMVRSGYAYVVTSQPLNLPEPEAATR